MDKDELKATFHRVSAYRHVCTAVRASAGHTLLSGFLFAFIAFMSAQVLGYQHPIFLIQAGLAVAEFAIFIWKKVSPSAEGVLLDALVNLIFGGSILIRSALVWQGMLPGAVSPVSIFIGCWALWDAYRGLNGYIQLRRIFQVRPTRSQMTYVDNFLRDIREANPQSDPTALNLPSQPRLKALLLDELAFFVDDYGEPFVLNREEVTLERSESDGQVLGLMTLEGQLLPPFPLSDANWRNYLRWKGEAES